MFSYSTEDQKRVDDRLDVVWSAVATIDEIIHPCVVTNISTAGALMKLNQNLEEGVQFLLNVESLDEYAASVVWANRPYYGLKLLVGRDLKLKDHADKIGLKSGATTFSE
ncbi:hypothetical protein [Paremcibacter congregatus]|uniref:PilZ domain-containing protein n=1 Tax=Paremcibacter congregatus TaxID=2043170 RepID=A0A2G4YTZ8_9PROT|nr:hypothetical protein [Paremcibacter congregatus]PHZ85811.1 hypothetical protein CRD36_03785 [Paremcibacter congregatus]QDE26774.1 hypothetical protein FIV45_05550 [Paremcibacter congregatus]